MLQHQQMLRFKISDVSIFIKNKAASAAW